jgi:phospholipase/carboxylesterase
MSAAEPGALHEDAASGLGYRVLEPRPAVPRALIVLLHGVGGREQDLAALGATLGSEVLVACGRGPLVLGPGRFGWFPVRFTPQGPSIDPAIAEHSRVQLLHFIATLQAQYGISPARTLVAGFSQGGIMSASVALTAPDRVAGFAVLSGRILPEIEPRLAGPSHLAPLTALIAHGRDDLTLPLAWAERADAWLTALGVSHETRIYPAAHEITAEMAGDFRDWVAAWLATR